MVGELTTRARWRRFWQSEPGELRLEGGLVSFTSDDRGPVFRAPLEEVRASFPKVLFPDFGVGIKLAVHGKTYRLSFARGHVVWTAPGGRGSGGGFGPGLEFPGEDTVLARAVVQRWRAALEKATNGGY
jgi:hypothetical protein